MWENIRSLFRALFENPFSKYHTLQLMIVAPPELERILAQTAELQKAYLVGGCVRDALLGIPHKDFDIEVFDITYEQLATALSRWGKTDLVGRSFGVVKLRVGEFVFDFTIPRRDSKVAPGHKGFDITFDPSITLQEAASRRDFTVNALMFDPRGKEILDFFGGKADLEKGILRHTSEAFIEDPLRVLRGMQFAARFNLQAAPETLQLCRQIKGSFSELAIERVREEWFKWAEKSAIPSAGLRFLRDTEWIEHFPELQHMIGTPQDPEWHPEGDVFTHTCHCCDALVRLPEWKAADAESRIVYSLAMLLHDCGKPQTTHEELRKGKVRIVSPGHENAGIPIAETFLNRTGTPTAIRERVLPLIQNHMAHYDEITDRAVRRLARRIAPETIEGLCTIMTADRLGRPPQPPQVPHTVIALLQKAHELKVQKSAPKPILLGRHLIEIGMQPSPEFGKILHEAYEAQLEGLFFDPPQARQWLATHPLLPENARERLRTND
ncbi:MAG: polynucleotide adenylyltransferase [Verrucomicrobiales bacterium]|nr:polynucleotide adenylyltransferase [Verrucomicrobiales bacterium]